MGLKEVGRIHLIRHAEPALSGVLLGRTDPPLQGLPPASELVVASVFASPLLRARDTAATLFPGQRVVIIENLTEISLGEWDGLAWEEIERRYPDLAAKKLADWFGVTPPGGESHATILGRATDVLNTIHSAKGPAAVIAHLGINAVLWHLLTGSPIAEFNQSYLEVKTHEHTNERTH